MTRLGYVDSSVLLKRVLHDVGADAARRWLREAADVRLVSSSLAWVEVSRALARLDVAGATVPDDAVEVALSGIAERPLTADVVAFARRLGPPELRSLDALHLATALVLDADLVATDDKRLAYAARHNRLEVITPADT